MQYADAFASGGVDITLWSLFREQELATWFGRRQIGRALLILRALTRIPAALRLIYRSDVVLVQREALPLGPPFLERLAARVSRLVWDVDDAIWTSFTSPTAGRVPGWLRAPGDKYAVTCSRAAEVWAGSRVLADWCRAHNPVSVHVVPTTVHVPEELPPRGGDNVVWIGSHSTGPFVEAVLPELASIEPPPQVVIVGANLAVPDGVHVSILPWSPDAEHAALASARLGLYPIDRSHPLAEGKCGLKAVLYMAHGVPPVVTPTTTNAEIVRDGVDGIHADSPAEWSSAVARLMQDDELANRLGAAGHERARTAYSAQVWGPRLARRVRELVEAPVP